jgi:hypothetical protein
MVAGGDPGRQGATCPPEAFHSRFFLPLRQSSCGGKSAGGLHFASQLEASRSGAAQQANSAQPDTVWEKKQTASSSVLRRSGWRDCADGSQVGKTFPVGET